MKHKFLLMTIAILVIAMNSAAQVTGTFTDSRDGKVYKTVIMGTQTWMAENFAYKASEGCWAYDNNESNVAVYGYLYDWKTAQSVCPSGWHLPSFIEFETLVISMGGNIIGANDNPSWTMDKNDSLYKTHLAKVQANGFNALMGGCRINAKTYADKEIGGYWWCSTQYKPDNIYKFWIYKDWSQLSLFFNSKKSYGYSVRYIKDI